MLPYGAYGKKALAFDGVDDYAVVNKQYSTPITVEALFKYCGIKMGYANGLIALNKYGGTTNRNIWIYLNHWNGTDKKLILSATDGTAYYEVTVYGGDLVCKPIHAVVVIDPPHFKAYLNAELLGVKAGVREYEMGGPLFISSDAQVPANMIAYAVRVYGRALTDAEIRENHAYALSMEQTRIRDGLLLELIPDTLNCDAGVWRDNVGRSPDASIRGAKCVAI